MVEHVDDLCEAPKDECGIFGVFAPDEDVARITFFGLFALQHRGQESAGIAVANAHGIRFHKDMGLVTHVFNEVALKNLNGGHCAIGHTRYSTSGSSVARNAQPICCTAIAGDIAVAHNGNLVNTRELRETLQQTGVETDGNADSELIARLIATGYKGDVVETLKNVVPQLEGAFSLVIMTTNALVGLRDPCGVRPLCIGRLDRGSVDGPGQYVLASETCALNVVGARLVREVEAGEMVVITSEGLTSHMFAKATRHATCLFEFIYFARPDSQMYGKSLHAARRRMGQELAREHPCPQADVVIPIPDSAIPAALGFAEAAHKPYSEGVVKNRYIQRTFIQPDQRMRELGARMKYTPLPEVISGRKVVMVDDSIVRGTTTGKLVGLLFEAGASEVHVRISAPPVKHACFYGIDMATQQELVASSKNNEEIRALIGATSLGYLSLDGVVKAVGLRSDKFCRACFDGKYPIPVPEYLKQASK